MAERESPVESMEIKKILVTGSEGYIGSVLVSKLLHKGYEVDGLDTCYFSNNSLGKNKDKYKLIKLDIREIESLDLSRYSAIIHLAGLSNDPMGELNEGLTVDINLKSTLNIAKAAKKAGVKRFIFSSSCSIYGIAKKEYVDEKSDVNPLTAYAKSKILSEKGLVRLADNNFCVGILRNSTVYGYSPRYRNDLVVNNLVSSGMVFGLIKIMSDGTPWRPLIDVRDLSDIFIKFLTVDSKKINGRIMNVGFKENNLQVKNIAEIINKYLTTCKIVYSKEHARDDRSYKVDFSLFKSTFPEIIQKWTIRRSIKDLIDHLKIYKFSKEDFSNGIFNRINEIKRLLKQKRINNNLFWL